MASCKCMQRFLSAQPKHLQPSECCRVSWNGNGDSEGGRQHLQLHMEPTWDVELKPTASQHASFGSFQEVWFAGTLAVVHILLYWQTADDVSSAMFSWFHISPYRLIKNKIKVTLAFFFVFCFVLKASQNISLFVLLHPVTPLVWVYLWRDDVHLGDCTLYVAAFVTASRVSQTHCAK